MRALIVLATCAFFAGCAAVPKVDDTPAGPAATPIVGARGPLTAQQSKALLDRITPEPGDAGLLKRHLAIEQAVAETPLVAGNATRLLVDGEQTFAAMFAAIDSAKATINLEYYIFEDVQSGGRHLGDLLIAKRQQGVAINIIYDSYGSSATPRDFFTRLTEAGINVVAFNPVTPLNPFRISNRDHRKILTVDGATAIVGGINLSATYESGSAKSGGLEGKPGQHWRDTDLEIRGPAVAQLQNLFLEHWTQEKGAALERERYFPTVPARGGDLVRVVGSTPDKEIPRFNVTLLSAIRNAEKNVWLSAAYFVPTDQEEEDLIGAARRGLDVRLLLPSDRWTAVGSSNFDPRSVVFNDEVDAVVLGGAVAQDFERVFQADMAKAKQIDRAAWARRPLGERFLELFELSSFLWQNWL